MARTGMANLIAELRGMCNAGSADYTINGVTYWTDDQLQSILDRRSTEVIDERLVTVSENNGGTTTYTRYYSRHGNYEATTGGSLVFVVKDANHSPVGTANYTPDYYTGEIVFAANTAGSAYYLTGRSYDLDAAAADVWNRKASQAMSASYSWSTDNMRVDKTAMRKEAVEMARYYRGMAGPASIDLTRGDTDA